MPKRDAASSSSSCGRKNAAKDDAAAGVLDEFDTTKPLDIKRDVCALCRRGHDFGVRLKQIMHSNTEEMELDLLNAHPLLDIDGVWASRYSLRHKSRRIFVHYKCAFFSADAYTDENFVWHNLLREVTRGSHIKCRICGKKGATIGCEESSCRYSAHFPCAAALYGFGRSAATKTLICEQHQAVQRRKQQHEDSFFFRDVAKGHELLPIAAANDLDGALLSHRFEYTPRSIDGDEVRGASQPDVHELQCCDCSDGICDDPQRCRCLRESGASYTPTGLLLPQKAAMGGILECNMKCACSVRRCSNRVVEKGITARLEIFRVRRDEYYLTEVSNSAVSDHKKLEASGSSSIGMSAVDVPSALDSSPSSSLQSVDSSSCDGSEDEGQANVQSEAMEVGIPAKMSAALLPPIAATAPLTNVEGKQQYASVIGEKRQREGITMSHDNQVHAIQEDETLTWGVRTLDSIPQYSFICEIAGQYVLGKSKPSYATWDHRIYGGVPVTDLVLEQYCIPCSSNHTDDTKRIFPVSLWEDSDKELEFASGAENVVTGNLRTVWGSHPQKVREYFDDQLCVDTRFFGNIGAFIRRYHDVAAAVDAECTAPRFTRPLLLTGDQYPRPILSASCRPAIPQQHMLIRRLVYCASHGSEIKRHPKLALFAATDIPAGTELLL